MSIPTIHTHCIELAIFVTKITMSIPTIVANKKSRTFAPRTKCMKNVDKDADSPKNKPYLLCRFMKSLKKYVPEECSCIEITNKAYFCGNPHPYLRFSYSFRPRGESATFLFATMFGRHKFGIFCHQKHKVNTNNPNRKRMVLNFMPPKRRFWNVENSSMGHF